MQTGGNILVPIDFSECSIDALRQAARLATGCNERLHVLHVIDALVAADLVDALRDPPQELHQQLINGAELRVHRALDDACATGIAEQCEVVIAAPLIAILQKIADLQAQLLVIGRNGATNPMRGPGGLALRCARKSQCDVLMVPQGVIGPFRRILVGVDFSEHSLRAVRRAIDVAGADKSTLHVAHFFFGPWNFLHYRSETQQANPAYQQQYRRSLEDRLNRFLEPVRPCTKLIELKSEIVADQANPGAGIIQHAEKIGADLIVVGTHGRTGLMRLLMGSTAERVVQDAQCAVLVVKAEGFQAPSPELLAAAAAGS